MPIRDDILIKPLLTSVYFLRFFGAKIMYLENRIVQPI